MKVLAISTLGFFVVVVFLFIGAEVFQREQPLERISPSGYTYASDGSLIGVSCDPLATQPCPAKENHNVRK